MNLLKIKIWYTNKFLIWVKIFYFFQNHSKKLVIISNYNKKIFKKYYGKITDMMNTQNLYN